MELLEMSMEGIALAFMVVQTKEQERLLLEETQSQSEELEAPQEELRQSNEELAARTDSLESQKAEIERKNTEIEEKAEDLAIASKYKSEFLANMSHELRTPLNSMLLLSNNLAKNKGGNLTADQIESISIVHQGGNALLSLINEILDLSKIEAGMMEIVINNVSIQEVANDLKLNFEPLTNDKGLDLKIQENKNRPASFSTDIKRLNQILKNLVSNAIKFTNAGSIIVDFSRPPTDARLSRSGLNPANAIAIAVTDTGIGIPSDRLKIIFEAFQQAEGGTSRSYGGTGLGLSISREIADLLGGEIQVQSEFGIGSTFTLFLPLDPGSIRIQSKISARPQTEQQVRYVQKSKSSAVVVEDDRQHLDESHKTVLMIIEDDPSFAKILRDQCASKGIKSIVTFSGEEGLELINRHQPSGIILDINLPGVDGWFVLNALKENPRTRHIPVHIMSIDEGSMKAIKQGAVGFLTKPVDQQGLDAAFSKLRAFSDKKVKDLLIVEDDAATRRGLIELMGNSDIKITEAATGKEALRVLKSGPFDCLILDLKLQDMSGFDLLDQLEQNKEVRIPPIIVYTGIDLTRKEQEQLSKYADSIIIKGVHSEERLLDETALFLHRMVEKLPQEKQKMIHDLYDVEQVFRNKKVMIVDDDIRNIFAVSQLLQEKGINVIKAEDGQRSLDLLNKEPDVDLVLMDIMMPGMDGHETTRRIREQDRFKNLPIIALTAKAMKDDREKCIAAGASDYIAKPVEEDRLFSMMRIWMYK